MNFFQEFGSETKTLIIVALATAVLAVGGVLLLKAMQPAPPAAGPAPMPQTPPPTPSPRPQAIDTAGWQTYRSEEFGFEVKYPGDIFALVENEGDAGYYGEAQPIAKLIFADRLEKIGKKECSYGERGPGPAEICRVASEKGISFAILPKKFSQVQAQFENFDPGVPPKQVAIAGREGLYFFVNFEHTYIWEYYYISLEEENTLVIQIEATATAKYEGGEFVGYDPSPSLDLVEQILSTFRFTP